MTTPRNDLMLTLLQACADRAPAPLYPAQYAKEAQFDRAEIDEALDELRSRGLVKFTDWVKDLGQGRALTDAGQQALAAKDLAPIRKASNVDAQLGPSTYQRGELVRGAVYGAFRPYVCWVFLALNIGYFLFGAGFAWWHELSVRDYLAGEDGFQRTTTIVLYELGAIHHAAVFPERHTGHHPEIERTILACFLHIGVLHLALNMWTLATLAGLVEAMWGRLRFLALYLIAGFVSSCVVVTIDMAQRQNNLTAGASGALYGVSASLFVWLYFNYQHLPEQLFQSWSRALLVNAFLLLGMNAVPGISWQGHLGGAVGGALAAVLLQMNLFHPNQAIRILALLALPFLPLAFFTLALWQAGWL